MSDFKFDISELADAFGLKGEITDVSPIDAGHINGTFSVTLRDENGSKSRFLMQQINTTVFRNPVGLMQNFVDIGEYLKKIIIENGGNPERECLHAFVAKDGNPYYIDKNGSFWRCINFVDGAHTVQQVESPEVFKKAAKAFGKFQCMLADYPAEKLVETIPNFHNTVSRFADFNEALDKNISGRADMCRDETAFVLAREKECGVLVSMLERGELPLRVTHNDTKLNNVMLDDETDEGICIVDLDTVMPGLSLYDFGDSIRFGASTAAEDEKDLDKVNFSLDYFRAYTEGFLSTAGESLTKEEIANLAFASKIMTLECGMRFLGDFINGDVYFRTDYPEHNLVRSRTQFKLVAEMEKYMDDMNRVVAETCGMLGLDK